jgi:hypothetical protein
MIKEQKNNHLGINIRNNRTGLIKQLDFNQSREKIAFIENRKFLITEAKLTGTRQNGRGFLSFAS